MRMRNVAGPESSQLSSTRPIDLDVEVADLLAQGVAVDAQEIGGADLVAARRGQRGGEERPFHLAQDAVVETGRRQVVVEFGKIVRQVALDRARQVLLAALAFARRDQRRLRQFGVDYSRG